MIAVTKESEILIILSSQKLKVLLLRKLLAIDAVQLQVFFINDLELLHYVLLVGDTFRIDALYYAFKRIGELHRLFLNDFKVFDGD